jgi:hypothetical protein
LINHIFFDSTLAGHDFRQLTLRTRHGAAPENQFIFAIEHRPFEEMTARIIVLRRARHQQPMRSASSNQSLHFMTNHKRYCSHRDATRLCKALIITPMRSYELMDYDSATALSSIT